MSYIWIKTYFPYLMLLGMIGFIIQTIFIAKNGRKVSYRITSILAVVIYLLAVFYVTLGFRTPGKDYDYELRLFWSYEKVLKYHNMFFLWENIANVIVFFPLGVFVYDFLSKKVRWYHNLFIGAGLSSVIEVTQLITKRGLFEFDDIFHNTLGSVLGYALAALLVWGINKHYKKKN